MNPVQSVSRVDRSRWKGLNRTHETAHLLPSPSSGRSAALRHGSGGPGSSSNAFRVGSGRGSRLFTSTTGRWGDRRLGYVRRGSDEIDFCALRRGSASLASCGEASHLLSSGRFAAVSGPGSPCVGSCSTTSCRHELGHIQVVDGKAKSTRRRFASETSTQEFAEHWCRELWSRPFDHPDPVHNPPTPEGGSRPCVTVGESRTATISRVCSREKAKRYMLLLGEDDLRLDDPGEHRLELGETLR